VRRTNLGILTLRAALRAAAADVSVLVCPLCAASVRLPPGRDVNAAWAAHAGDPTACDPSAYAQRTHKPRCPVKGCKEKLTFSNRVACKACGANTCLRHRFPADHACERAAAAAAAARRPTGMPSASASAAAAAASVAAAVRRATSAAAALQPTARAVAAPPPPPRPSTRLPPPASAAAARRAAAAPQYAAADNSVRGTAERRAASAAAAAALPESCPLCAARFADVAALIAHAETAHAAASSIGTTQGRLREVCPACGARFADAVALVAHHAAEHAATRRGAAASSCVVC
jgi:hypothetical protein